MSEPARRRVHALVSGRVQGVGFRFFVVRQAQRLGLAGWVRNLPDGRVEFEAEGPAGSVDALVHAVQTGPPQAQVTDVTVAERPPSDELPRPFDVR